MGSLFGKGELHMDRAKVEEELVRRFGRLSKADQEFVRQLVAGLADPERAEVTYRRGVAPAA